MVKFEVEAILGLDAETYWRDRDTPAFRAFMCTIPEMGLKSVELVSQSVLEDGSTFQVVLNTPSADLPGVLKKFLGGQELTFTDEITTPPTAPPYVVSVRSIPSILSEKATIAGELIVEPIDSKSCKQIFRGSATVNVFGLGSTIETVVKANLKAGYKTLPMLIDSWKQVREEMAANDEHPEVPELDDEHRLLIRLNSGTGVGQVLDSSTPIAIPTGLSAGVSAAGTSAGSDGRMAAVSASDSSYMTAKTSISEYGTPMQPMASKPPTAPGRPISPGSDQSDVPIYPLDRQLSRQSVDRWSNSEASSLMATYPKYVDSWNSDFQRYSGRMSAPTETASPEYLRNAVQTASRRMSLQYNSYTEVLDNAPLSPPTSERSDGRRGQRTKKEGVVKRIVCCRCVQPKAGRGRGKPAETTFSDVGGGEQRPEYASPSLTSGVRSSRRSSAAYSVDSGGSRLSRRESSRLIPHYL
eukprot:GFYU01005050.1.p1 GENE.GFYU01005050.1~~GFYU01005050.1.p1  ORF type:complete len:469 (-),score=75.23 GFYU01005050.1:1043-2449(-)